MSAVPMYTTSATTSSWSNNVYVTYGGLSVAPVKAAPPRRKTNLARLHDRVEATCAKARLAA